MLAPRDFFFFFSVYFHFFFNLKENPSAEYIVRGRGRNINIVQHSSVAMRRDFRWLQGIT